MQKNYIHIKLFFEISTRWRRQDIHVGRANPSTSVRHAPRSSGWLTPHDDVIKWKYFPRYWPFVREIHRSPVNFPHKGQWRGALMFTLICARKNGWVNNGEAGDLRRYLAHYDVIVMGCRSSCCVPAALLSILQFWWFHLLFLLRVRCFLRIFYCIRSFLSFFLFWCSPVGYVLGFHCICRRTCIVGCFHIVFCSFLSPLA